MAQAVTGHSFLVRRLREWSLFRAVTLKLPWSPEDLLAPTNWLQLKTAEANTGANTEANQVLIESGRTKRIRNTAKATLKHQSEQFT